MMILLNYLLRGKEAEFGKRISLIIRHIPTTLLGCLDLFQSMAVGERRLSSTDCRRIHKILPEGCAFSTCFIHTCIGTAAQGDILFRKLQGVILNVCGREATREASGTFPKWTGVSGKKSRRCQGYDN